MARMSLAKSLKLKKIRGPAEESGSADEEEPSAVCRRYGSAILWCIGWGIVSLSGYLLGDSGTLNSNPMWKNNLFSEHVSPGRMHTSLLQSRKTSLSLGDLDNATGMTDLWDPPPENGWKPCAEPNVSKSLPPAESGYLQVFCTGGLFQLHICVCNAVAAAKMLNATLLIPYFRRSIVWEDPSQFHDIYDIDHFMSYLKEDLSVVSSLPKEYEWSTPELYDDQCEAHPNCLPFPPKHATKDWHMTNVLPILQRHGIAAIERYHHKLSFEDLPSGIVNIRCHANFYALRFVHPIVKLSEILVTRLKRKAKLLQKSSPHPIFVVPDQEFKNNSQHWWELGIGGLSKKLVVATEAPQKVAAEGSFLGLHVRFEKDMVAHSACYYDGGRAEQRALASYRRVVFKNRVAKALIQPTYLRMNGSCPLTPEEMGLLLAGLGFKNHTVVYTAGKLKSLYGGKARLQPLKDIFPLLESKESLSTPQELGQFLPYAHKLAALDFLVLLSSNVFMSNAAGNFPNVLTGQRTFFGPRKSIHPDKALLAKLFRNSSLGWADFSKQATAVHITRLGSPEQRKRKYSVFRYPAPDCMCQARPSSVSDNNYMTN